MTGPDCNTFKMYKVSMKRKNYVLDDFGDENFEANLPDIIFNLPNFMFELIDQETMSLITNFYSTNTFTNSGDTLRRKFEGITKEIKSEKREDIITTPYLKNECQINSLSPNERELYLCPENDFQHKNDESKATIISDQKDGPRNLLSNICSTSAVANSTKEKKEIKTEHGDRNAIPHDNSFQPENEHPSTTSMNYSFQNNELKHSIKKLKVDHCEKAKEEATNYDSVVTRQLSKTFNVSCKSRDVVIPNIWKMVQQLEKKSLDEVVQKNIRSDIVKENKIKKTPQVEKHAKKECDKIKSVIMPEEKARRKKLVKMQKMRNLNQGPNDIHSFGGLKTMNIIQESINNRQPSYNPKEAQEFMKKKKQEMLNKKKMEEENMKIKEVKRRDELDNLRKKQIEFARNSDKRKKHDTLCSVKCQGQLNKFIISQAMEEVDAAIKNDDRNVMNSKMTLKNLSENDTSKKGNDFLENPNIKIRKDTHSDPIEQSKMVKTQEPTAKDILFKYAEMNKLNVNEVIVNFGQHANNIRFYLLNGRNATPADRMTSMSKGSQRLTKMKTISHLLNNKIHHNSRLINKTEGKEEGNKHGDQINFSQKGSEIGSPTNHCLLQHQGMTNCSNLVLSEDKILEHHSMFNVILKDLEKEDPFNIFNIFAKGQYQQRLGLGENIEKGSIKVNILWQNLRNKIGNNGDITSEASTTSITYDDDFISAMSRDGMSNVEKSMTSQSKGKALVCDYEDVDQSLDGMQADNDLGSVQFNNVASNSQAMEKEGDKSGESLDDLVSERIEIPCTSEGHSSASLTDCGEFDQSFKSDDILQSKMNPGELELRLVAEINLMEILDSSLIHLNNIENSKVVSEVNQENIALGHIMKSQEVTNMAQMDEVLKKLNEGFVTHQQQKMELLHLQEEIQFQQFKETTLSKEDQLQHGDYKGIMKEVQNMQQEMIKLTQQNVQMRQQKDMEHIRDQESQTPHYYNTVASYYEDILGSSLAGVIELQKEAALNLVKMTTEMKQFSSDTHLEKFKMGNERLPCDGKYSKHLKRKNSKTEMPRTIGSKPSSLSKADGEYSCPSSDHSHAHFSTVKSLANKHINVEISSANILNGTEIDNEHQELNTNNSRGTIELRECSNWNEFSTSMVHIHLKEELAMQQHKLLLLSVKSRSLERLHKMELMGLEENLKSGGNDEEVKRMIKKKMKMDLNYKMKKAELKRLMGGVQASIDACKMMTNETENLHRWMGTRNAKKALGEELGDFSGTSSVVEYETDIADRKRIKGKMSQNSMKLSSSLQSVSSEGKEIFREFPKIKRGRELITSNCSEQKHKKVEKIGKNNKPYQTFDSRDNIIEGTFFNQEAEGNSRIIVNKSDSTVNDQNKIEKSKIRNDEIDINSSVVAPTNVRNGNFFSSELRYRSKSDFGEDEGKMHGSEINILADSNSMSISEDTSLQTDQSFKKFSQISECIQDLCKRSETSPNEFILDVMDIKSEISMGSVLQDSNASSQSLSVGIANGLLTPTKSLNKVENYDKEFDSFFIDGNDNDDYSKKGKSENKGSIKEKEDIVNTIEGKRNKRVFQGNNNYIEESLTCARTFQNRNDIKSQNLVRSANTHFGHETEDIQSPDEAGYTESYDDFQSNSSKYKSDQKRVGNVSCGIVNYFEKKKDKSKEENEDVRDKQNDGTDDDFDEDSTDENEKSAKVLMRSSAIN